METEHAESTWKARWKITRSLRKFYDWILGWSHHPKGEFALYFLSAIEAIFFPIPVDPVLLAMGAGKPKKALKYAALTSVFSVLGACVGYYLGATFWDATHEFFYSHVFSQDKFEIVMGKFHENAFLAIFLSAFTPLPYKVFAIAGGVAGISLPIFIIGSLLGRSIRFMAIGVLLYKFGPAIKDKIDQNFEKITMATGALLVVLVVIYKTLF